METVLAAGVTAVSVLGSTGEGPLVPAAAKRRVVEATLRIVDGRVPLVAGSQGGPPQDVARESRAWAELGADCILASPPSYFHLNQEEVVEYYGELASGVGAPILVYHFPALTKVAFTPATVAVLARIEEVIGIKDSSGDEAFLKDITAATAGTGFAVLAGSGRIASLAAAVGAHGIVAASANLIPAQLVRLWAALASGSRGEAEELQELVTAVEGACREYPYPMNWKAAVRWSGVDCGRPLPPLVDLSQVSYEALGQTLASLVPLRAVG